MATTQTPIRAAAQPLPADLRLGAAHLTVTDLDRSIAFYEGVIGLQTSSRAPRLATLGAGREDLLVLHEDPDAVPAGRHAGLYHVALLFPSRLELARVVKRIATSRTPIQGASDHGISWAVYLPDPDGNGVELAADQPQESWPDLSDISAIAPQPLDLSALLDLVAAEPMQETADPATVVGHVHLHVSSVDAALPFYVDVLGFDLITHIPNAAFMSAGGYHHHVAVNTWRGEGIAPVPANAVGLRHWTLLVDAGSLAEIEERVRAAGVEPQLTPEGLLVRDPAGNALLFSVDG